VIYRRHGDLVHAERLARMLLARAPDNPTFIANLATVLSSAGKQQETLALTQKLRRIEPYPPFYFVDQGRNALNSGNRYAAKLERLRAHLDQLPYVRERTLNPNGS